MNTPTNTFELNAATVVRGPQKGVILRKFADEHRLKTSLDNCGELVIIGRQGQIYEYSDTLLGVMFLPSTPRARLWGKYRRLGMQGGMQLAQDGDSEGSLLFVPDHQAQVQLALKIAKVRKRRVNSGARKELLRGYLAKARQALSLERDLRA